MPNQSTIEIIAEIAQAHEGSLGIAHSYIDALQDSGADTIKFQMHIAEAESSDQEQFRVKFSYEDNTRYDYWKRMEFDLEQWAGLKKHCEDKGFRFLCSPFSIKAVDWMEKLNVDRYKIASGEVSNSLMLDKICRTGKSILMSSGMSGFEEILSSIDFISKHNGNFEGIFQCTTSYPTPPEKYGLNVLSELKKLNLGKVGLSDHSGEIYSSLAAVTMGAEMLELHVVFDKSMFGPDAKSSLTISEFKQLADGVRKIERALKNPVDKNDTDQYGVLKTMFGKSLALNKELKAGHILTFEDLETKKPAELGISAKDYKTVIGKKLKSDMSKNSFLNFSDLNG
ncbi:MAG TPA: N-acetylneuraminate synthase family protein [Bacteroidia bacterium]